VLSVGDRVADDVLEEGLEDGTSFLVDEARDTLDTTTASETADSGLGDTLDVVTKDLENVSHVLVKVATESESSSMSE
jgi:hypothetical protein